jgi:hypothetical protein
MANIQFSEMKETKEKAITNNQNISSLYGLYIDSSKVFSVGKRKEILGIGACSNHFATLLALVNSKKA